MERYSELSEAADREIEVAIDGQVPGLKEVRSLYNGTSSEVIYADTDASEETTEHLEAEAEILGDNVGDELVRQEPDPEDSLGARGDFPTNGNDIESVEQMAPTANISF